MQSMIELHPRPDALHGLGLPAIPYPVALPAFQAAVANDGELPLADMLHGLQLRAAEPAADWQRMAPAMVRLAELLAPDDTRAVVTPRHAAWLDVGPVAAGADTVTLQRDGLLLAALAPADGGRLRLSAWRALDGHAIGLLLALAHDAAAPDLVDLHNTWQRALAAAAADPGHASEQGPNGLAHWKRGLGSTHDDGRQSADWQAQEALPTRRAACVAAEIDTFHALCGARR